MTRAGLLTVTHCVGISWTTTLPAPMTAFDAIVTPPKMINRAPIHAPSAMLIGLLILGTTECLPIMSITWLPPQMSMDQSVETVLPIPPSMWLLMVAYALGHGCPHRICHATPEVLTAFGEEMII